MRSLHHAAFAALFCLAAPAAAEEAGPVAVELFSSQSCYSCPPAEEFLAELAGERDVVALEWHVDYWDRLVYGSAGAWKDPFSSPAHTRRQRRYNERLTGAPRAYTPQIVVAGAAEAVGSKRREVRALIAEAGPPPLTVATALAADGRLTVSVEGDAPGEVWLARFQDEAVTRVPRGENHGKTLANAHVVREFLPLGAHDGGATAFAIDAPSEGEGCAILVHGPGQGPVLGAAYCAAGS
ncbi:MAG: DUF1223 domain-containing protein [Caulobacterales bacterium]|nr:DUF1223 domain-containing protein [Caulobacterales bacterium]